MNLLFIRTTTGFSGAERYHEYLFSGLKKEKNIRITLLTNYRKFYERIRPWVHSSKLLYLPIHEVGTKQTLAIALLWLPYLLPLYLWNIKQLERKKRFDCIILESTTEKLFLTPVLKVLGYRVIWIEHAPMFDTNRAEIVKVLYRWVSRWADHIVAASQDTNRDLALHGIHKEKITTLYIGIETRDRHASLKPPVTGFIGGLTVEKGITEFVRVFEQLSKQFPYLHAIVLGDGPKRIWLMEQIKKKQLKHIQVLGFVDNVWEHLSSVTIAFFPTKHKEGLSLAILETLAAGCLVVARDIGGNREIVINGKTGYLFETDKESLIILQEILAGKRKIPKLQINISRLFSEKFSEKKQTKKFIQLFSHI